MEFKVWSVTMSDDSNNTVLIESDWNLKLKPSLYSLLEAGINRIRLEFKVYVWNHLPWKAYIVLIESDWNLKGMPEQVLGCNMQVLIESDWNLKYHWLLRCSRYSGINRIRLEFKANNKSHWWNRRFWVLIESDWNLKKMHELFRLSLQQY